MIRYNRNGITIHEADALNVAATLPADHFTLAILDGPYAMNKAAWDRLKVDDLPRFYRPHLEAADRILAPSASLYVWNTAEGWATLHPLIVSMGWTFRGLIVWEKTGAHPARIGAANSSAWPDVTEVCGHYQRGGPFHENQTTGNVWRFSPTTEMNGERIWSDTIRLHLVTHAMQRAGLHPCQKPLLFAERMIRASSRPGERVWVPFGGTCREAIAADAIRRADPSEAREVVTCELNQDGPDYLAPVVRILNGEGSAPINKKQAILFPHRGTA